jgi:hypothetical protein
MKYSEAEKKKKSKELDMLSAYLLKTGAPISGSLKTWIKKQQGKLR